MSDNDLAELLTRLDKPYIHKETKNTSFLHMSKYLRKNGIVNNKFMLTLYDETLKNVDVYANNLTSSEKARIHTEIKKNPWYYLREVVRISTPAGASRFKMHPGNMALVWSIFNSFNTMIELPRQQFKTVSICGALSWFYDFVCENTSMYFGNKSIIDSKNNLKRFKDIRDNHPEWLKRELNAKGDIDNQESILAAKPNNKIDIHGNPPNAVKADLMGRGMSIPILWEDEYAFLSHNSVLMKAAAPAHNTVAQIAEENNRPHSKIISTTPNNVDKESGLQCKLMMNDACEFIEEMYDWSREKVKEYINENSMNDFIYIKYTWKQLGLSDAWYRQQCRDLLNDMLTINREINLAWTRSSDNSVFGEEDLLLLESIINKQSFKHKIEFKRYVPYLEEFHTHTYFLTLYQPLDPNKKYFIGCDVAAGLSRDRSTIVITDPENDFTPVGFFRSSTINTEIFAHLLRVLVKEHIPKSILFIENNSLGTSVITNLVDYIPKNIYYSYRVQDKQKGKNPATQTDNIVLGVNTNSTSREIMFDILRDMVTNTPNQVAFRELYDEIKNLAYIKGRIDHEPGHHDDIVMGYLIVRYAVDTGNNISKFIGKGANQQTVDAVLQKTGAHSIGNRVEGNKSATVDIKEIIILTDEGYTVDEAMAILLSRGSVKNHESKAKSVNVNMLYEVLR